MFSNIPDRWYPTLLTIRSMVPSAKNSLESLQNLQHLITTQSDWRFYYECIATLADTAKNGATEEIRAAALNGTANEPGLVKFLQWAPYRIKKDRNFWLQNKAKEEHAGIVSGETHDLEMGEEIKEGELEERRFHFSMDSQIGLQSQETKQSYSSRSMPSSREPLVRGFEESVSTPLPAPLILERMLRLTRLEIEESDTDALSQPLLQEDQKF